MEKLFVILLIILFNFLRSCQTSVATIDDDCEDPNSIQLSIQDMCELVPDRGRGREDIIRIYYNPVLQQCLPFSWSGEGGNANRFLSVKNCYEICHPSDPGIRKITSSGIRPYLIEHKRKKKCKKSKKNGLETGLLSGDKSQTFGKDVVIRQLKHPFDEKKTLTIVQPIDYRIDPNLKPEVVIEKKDEKNGWPSGPFPPPPSCPQYPGVQPGLQPALPGLQSFPGLQPGLRPFPGLQPLPGFQPLPGLRSLLGLPQQTRAQPPVQQPAQQQPQLQHYPNIV